MDYNEATDWLYAQLPMFSRVGAAAYKPGLERSYMLAKHFDNPHKKFKSIHVGGTNGKGSVSNLLSAVLQSQGYKVGLYTSPHLKDFRERMRINGEMITEEEVIEFVDKWQHGNYVGDKPSFFELTMIMAFEWFARKEVDYAIIEVGMGGRLDSTNIITPLLSIITNISKDHVQFLGDTLEKIAFEKAGIIKPGVPVVIGEAEKTTENVFRTTAEERNAPILEAYNEPFDISHFTRVCPLEGDYQIKNIKTAIASIGVLRKSGIEISDNAIENGFSNVNTLTGFYGRWTILNKEPLIICDTGHNEAGLRHNLSQLNRIKSERNGATIRFVIGFVADKDMDNILRLFPGEEFYYLTQAQLPRALPYKELQDKFLNLADRNHGDVSSSHIKAFSDVDAALEMALNDSDKNDIIYIGGSTFVVADALKNIDSIINH